MDISEYKNIFDNEEHHFFYKVNHEIILSLVEKYWKISKRDKKACILDAGCGTGLLATKLKQYGDVYGIDIHPQAVAFSKRRGVKVQQASTEEIPFADNFFDLLISMDVLYHQKVKDDMVVLAELFRVLKPEGILIIRVPAKNWLFASHDVFVHTRKRYEKKELSKKLLSAGFQVILISYVNALLFFPVLIRSFYQRLNPSKTPASSVKHVPVIINRLLTFFLSQEIGIIIRGNMPFGIGLVAVAVKPKKI